MNGVKHDLPIQDYSPFLIAPVTKGSRGSGSSPELVISEQGDIHVTYNERFGSGAGIVKNTFTYTRKAGEKKFTKHEGVLMAGLAWNNRFYRATLSRNGRINITSGEPGSVKYQSQLVLDTNRSFGDNTQYIEDGKLVIIVAENKQSDKKEIYSYVFDLGGNGVATTPSNQAPIVDISSPANNATFELGQEIVLSAGASDADGDLDKVNFFVNDAIVSSDNSRPFETKFTPTAPGTYTIIARAIDKENLKTDASVTITIVEKNVAPTASFSTPVQNTIEQGYSQLIVTVDALKANAGKLTVLLKINGKDVRSESVAPYEWGHTGSPNPEETLGLTVGENILKAIVTDDNGLSTIITKTLTVTAKNAAPTAALSSPVQGDVYSVGEDINLSALATDPDGNLDKVNFKINDDFYKTTFQRPFKDTFTPDSAGTYKIAAKAFDRDGLATEVFVNITVSSTLSNDNFENNNTKLKVYPSPTNSILNVSGLNNDCTKATIINAMGSVVINRELNNKNNPISVSLLANGMYFLKLQNESTTEIAKFIKN